MHDGTHAGQGAALVHASQLVTAGQDWGLRFYSIRTGEVTIPTLPTIDPGMCCAGIVRQGGQYVVAGNFSNDVDGQRDFDLGVRACAYR
jgi:hypothetical protein